MKPQCSFSFGFITIFLAEDRRLTYKALPTSRAIPPSFLISQPSMMFYKKATKALWFLDHLAISCFITL